MQIRKINQWEDISTGKFNLDIFELCIHQCKNCNCFIVTILGFGLAIGKFID